ncbi:hypothetical protein [Streptomyces sp. NPDC053367]|uniref:hypothetical protein n=1 Tax=Streptomyces sp. NPDC053367 TaxID=3365700 RepID=UPI0037CDD921
MVALANVRFGKRNEAARPAPRRPAEGRVPSPVPGHKVTFEFFSMHFEMSKGSTWSYGDVTKPSC